MWNTTTALSRLLLFLPIRVPIGCGHYVTPLNIAGFSSFVKLENSLSNIVNRCNLFENSCIFADRQVK